MDYVLDVAARGRWRAWHVPMPVQRVAGGGFVPDPRGAGIPDLILMHALPARLVFAELKVGSALRPEQAEFLELAGKVSLASAFACGGCRERTVGAYVWTWPESCDELERVLLTKALG